MKFELNEKQIKKYKEWSEAINTVYGEYGSFTFCFKLTGLGDIITVENDLVGDKAILDLTDVDSW